MCPIWPLHLILLYVLALFPLWALCQVVPQLTASFDPQNYTLHMDESIDVSLSLTGLTQAVQAGDQLHIQTRNPHIASVNYTYQILTAAHIQDNNWADIFKLDGNFLGLTSVEVKLVRPSTNAVVEVEQTMPVTVIRAERIIDTIFTSSVATLVSLIFINFGCAMHWPTVKAVCKRPIGPIIGMFGQFLFMPLCSFVLGLLIFPNDPEMRLGLFFTGVSPGGGASNIWTFILGGNLNLSLAMTTISTCFAFGFMPAWLFSLGHVIFADANIGVPYVRIITFILGLLVPLGIGLAMQRYTPRLAAFMVRILKGFSSALLLFIIVFAIITNLYIFELFSWEIIVAGMGLPWLGYCVGYAAARIFRQPHEDAIAISVETGIQNTGISIFLLRFALQQPAADLTTVIPVSVAIMTPVPMTCIFIYQKIKGCIVGRNQHKKMINDEARTPMSVESPEVTSVSAITVK